MKFRLLNEQNIFFEKIASHLQSTIKKKNQRIEKFNPPSIISPPLSLQRCEKLCQSLVHSSIGHWRPRWCPPFGRSVATGGHSNPFPPLVLLRSKCQPLPWPSAPHWRSAGNNLSPEKASSLAPFPFTYLPSSTNVMKFGKFSIIGESNLTTGTVEIRDTQGRGWNDVSGDESCG